MVSLLVLSVSDSNHCNSVPCTSKLIGIPWHVDTLLTIGVGASVLTVTVIVARLLSQPLTV